jgi:hypothetical protein
MNKLILLLTFCLFSTVSWSATYEVTGSDGQIYDIEGRAGASDQELIDAVKQHLAEEKRLLDAKKSSAIVGSPTTSYRGNKQRYPIEVAHNDELFIINGEKYEAKTYCFNMEEGDSVIFLEGSALGVCVSAELLNLRSGTECRVWCE